MRKNGYLLSVFLLLASLGHAQSMKDLFHESDVKFYWFGIDYSHVQLIGTFNQIFLEGSRDPNSIKNTYFPGWNALFVREADKYNVSAMLHGKQIETKIGPIYKINNQVDPLQLDTVNEVHYTPAQIQDFVKEYDFGTEEGIGAFFVAESLNKEQEHGIYHLVFLNLATNEVLHTQSFTGKAGGFGIRNYYAKSFRLVMEHIQKKAFDQWKKLYAGE